MDKKKIFNLSKQLINIAQDNGISTKRLKTYAALLAISTGTMISAITPTMKADVLDYSPYKPSIKHSVSTHKHTSDVSSMDLTDFKAFLSGDGQAGVYDNPFAVNEVITLVHADQFESLADLNDPDKWAARVASQIQVNIDTPSTTICDNSIDWNVPVVSLSGKCFTVMNLQQADNAFANVNNKSELTHDDMRLFVLLHEAARGHSISRSMSALHENSETELFRSSFMEMQSDLGAFYAISKSLSHDKMNTLFDALIQSRARNNSAVDNEYLAQGLLLITKALYSEDPVKFRTMPTDEIIFNSTLMIKAYINTSNKADFFPNFKNQHVIAASIDGIVSQLKERESSPAKTQLMNVIGLEYDQVRSSSNTQLTDAVMSNINSINTVVEASRSNEKFESLIANDISKLVPHINTSAFKLSLNKLMNAELDTPAGYSNSINKVQAPIMMEL